MEVVLATRKLVTRPVVVSQPGYGQGWPRVPQVHLLGHGEGLEFGMLVSGFLVKAYT